MLAIDEKMGGLTVAFHDSWHSIVRARAGRGPGGAQRAWLPERTGESPPSYVRVGTYYSARAAGVWAGDLHRATAQ